MNLHKKLDEQLLHQAVLRARSVIHIGSRDTLGEIRDNGIVSRDDF
jgi:hypothetical protein